VLQDYVTGSRTLTGVTVRPVRTDASSSSSAPCPRWGHAATLHNGSQVLLYGGQNAAEEVLGDAYRLDLSGPTAKWSLVDDGALGAPKRTWHKLVAVEDVGAVVAFGEVTRGSAAPSPARKADGAASANDGSASASAAADDLSVSA
jgi:hypothetical protein